MGYPHEVAKQALIIVKNAGIAEAIDVIPLVIETMEKEKKYLKDDKILNMCWDCPDCTFLNQNQNFNCEICGRQAPDEAYTTVKKEKQLQSENQNIIQNELEIIQLIQQEKEK